MTGRRCTRNPGGSTWAITLVMVTPLEANCVDIDVSACRPTRCVEAQAGCGESHLCKNLHASVAGFAGAVNVTPRSMTRRICGRVRPRPGGPRHVLLQSAPDAFDG